ncbi:MFS transporter [Arthrobacter sp. 31Y]|uniref:MFS transporter n=1 Tax=Arthrobacter sp. 31Y TaxID=1115632 RepID=UPI0004664D81|nr:MFS transporter [Arthrobacter sp. 31Y]
MKRLHNPRKHSALVPLALLFVSILLDGLDQASLGIVIPVLSKEWGIPPAGFTTAVVATNAGVVLGMVSSGWFAQKFDRRTVIWVSTLFFSALVLLTPLVSGIEVFTVLRLVTGVGLGAMVPAALSLAADLVPEKRRSAAVIITALGLAAGNLLAGLTGGIVISRMGWEAVFWLPGIISIAFAGVLRMGLPRREPVSHAATDGAPAGTGAPAARVRDLFRKDLRLPTLVLWGLAFLIFATGYNILNWMPTLLVEYGFSVEQAPLATAAFGAGTLLGGVLMAAIAAYRGASRAVSIMIGVAVIALPLMALVSESAPITLFLVALAAAGTATPGTGLAALATGIYRGHLQTVGVGWTTAMGRCGSIMGPAIGGLFLALRMPASSIILTLTIPAVLAGFLAVLFGILARSRDLKEIVPQATATSGNPLR